MSFPLFCHSRASGNPEKDYDWIPNQVGNDTIKGKDLVLEMTMLLNNLRYLFWIALAIFTGVLTYKVSSKPIDYFAVYIGFLLSFLAIFLIDYFARPNLKICLGSEDDAPDGSLRFLHINIINLDNPKWFFIFRRRVAEYCKVRLTFSNSDGTTLFSMFGRWSAKGEPITPDRKVDISKFPEGTVTSIASSKNLEDLKEGKMGVAVKFEGENECYGFNDWSYAFNFKHPQFKLKRGKYKVDVEVSAGTQTSHRSLRLENQTNNIRDFRLLGDKIIC